jgi:uncharacterized protein YggE
MNLAWMAALMFAAAQDGGPSTVTVSAAGKVEKTATALQFSFQLSAKGDDVAKAVEALQAKQKEAMASLKTLGAVEKDVVVTVPSIEKKDPNQARVMRMKPSNRLKKKKEEEKPEKEPVVVMVAVTARLPLQGKDHAALFVESEQLKEKVKAAKLIEKEKKDAAEGEEEDEMMARMQQYQEQSGMEDGFYFQFWAASEPKDVDAAAAKAMENAKTLAQAGARASGKTLTGPTGVEMTESGATDASQYMMQEYYYYQRGRRSGMPTTGPSTGIVSMTLDGLAATVMLKVTFGLK